MNTFIGNFNLTLYKEIIKRGLSRGLGHQYGRMCIEAAICAASGLPHSDDPKCVDEDFRQAKIKLNDSNWSSPETRAKGLYKLGVAQLGSKDVFKPGEFKKKISEKLIRKLIPKLFREIFQDENIYKNKKDLLNVADKCEKEGSVDAAYAAANAAYAAANAAANPAYADDAYAAYATANAAADANPAYAADAADAKKEDEYLSFVADLMLEVCIELKSPGVELLDKL